LQRARHWASLRPVRRVAWPALPQAEWLAALVPLAAVRYAQVAAPSSRARVPSRVPAAQRPAVETAVRVAWPSAVGAAEVVRSGAEAAAGVVQPDVAAAEGVARLGAAAAGVVAQPGAVAEEAEPAAAVARAAQDVPPGELPSGVAWAFRQDLVLPSVPPRPAPTARAMGWSWSVAWPSTRSWQAALFSGVSCALGPAENLKVVKGGKNLGEVISKRHR
jgi:hypothetical protein